MVFIIPSDQEQAGFTTLLKNIIGISFSSGRLKQKTGNIDFYNTIINCRKNLELILNKLNLQIEYYVDKRWKPLKIIKDNIVTKITEETAFEIKVIDMFSRKSSEMANFIIQN